MAKYFFVSIFGLFLFAQTAFAQRSATAVMQVSASVVSGAEIDTDISAVTQLNRSDETPFGKFKINGTHANNMTVRVSDRIILQGESAKVLSLDINTLRFNNSDDSIDIQLQARPEQVAEKGIYTGQLTTVIEYN